MKAPKCLCPTNCQDIHDNKMMELDTVRCGKKPYGILSPKDHPLNGWPICKGHMGFFVIHNIPSKGVFGRFSMLPSVITPEVWAKMKEEANV